MLVDALGRPRYWTSYSFARNGSSWADSTKFEYLSAIGRFYLFMEAQGAGDVAAPNLEREVEWPLRGGRCRRAGTALGYLSEWMRQAPEQRGHYRSSAPSDSHLPSALRRPVAPFLMPPLSWFRMKFIATSDLHDCCCVLTKVSGLMSPGVGCGGT